MFTTTNTVALIVILTVSLLIIWRLRYIRKVDRSFYLKLLQALPNDLSAHRVDPPFSAFFKYEEFVTEDKFGYKFTDDELGFCRQRLMMLVLGNMDANIKEAQNQVDVMFRRIFDLRAQTSSVGQTDDLANWASAVANEYDRFTRWLRHLADIQEEREKFAVRLRNLYPAVSTEPPKLTLATAVA